MAQQLLASYILKIPSIEPTTVESISLSTSTANYNSTTSITIAVALADSSAYNGTLNLSYGSYLSGSSSVTCVDGTATISVTSTNSFGSSTITVTVPASDTISTDYTQSFTLTVSTSSIPNGTYYNSNHTYWITGVSSVSGSSYTIQDYAKCYFNGVLVADMASLSSGGFTWVQTESSGISLNGFGIGTVQGTTSAPSDGSSSLTYYKWSVIKS